MSIKVLKLKIIVKSLIFFLTIILLICIVFTISESYKEPDENEASVFKNFKITSKKIKKFNNSRVDVEGKIENYVKYDTKKLHKSITLVTAFFDLGSFQKGDTGFHNTNMYKKWITIFKRIDNNLIIYLETADFEAYAKILRKDLMGKTKIVRINRHELENFKNRDEFARIFKQKGYPSYHPNTIYPEYPCLMHAKYELMRRSIISNPFRSGYFAWIDIGLFRGMVEGTNPLVDNHPLFSLHLPPKFNASSVAYSQVNARRPHLTATDIIYTNLVWVCGCYFIASVRTMFKWTAEYAEGVRWLMSRGLMSTDQQVIYILHNNLFATTPLQAYSSDGSFDKWFYLAYISRLFHNTE